MNYEQKYKEALKELREHFLPTTDGTPVSGISRRQIEDIFPELKESEDEKIRKLLIRKITQERGSLSNDEATKCIVWLEKQKDTLKDTLKDIEQNPAWSEEDEEFLSEIISDIKFAQDKHPDSQMNQIIFDEEVTWLKSLKERYTWKPSEVQIIALEGCVDYLNESDNEDLLVMESLLEQLKAL